MVTLKSASRLVSSLLLLFSPGAFHAGALAASFAESVFATGAPLGPAQPNSVTYANGSVWVAYGNNAPTMQYSGSGTIVQYGMTGSVQNTYSLAGSIGGLKYNQNTGQFWVLQGQDAFSQLSIIDPASKTISSYAFADPIYYTPGVDRASDDVAFIGNNVFLNQTHNGLAVVVQLVNPNPSGPMALTTTLGPAGLLATDPRNLNSTPDGGLILTGRTDQALTLVTDPGQPDQTANSIHLVAAPGTTIGQPGDALYAGAASGTFYLTDSGTNIVYSVAATGLNPDTLFVNVGDEFGSVDPNTGVVTPLLFGSDLVGMTFVPGAPTVPEPPTFGLLLAAAALFAVALFRTPARLAKGTLPHPLNRG